MAALGARRAAIKVAAWARDHVPLYAALYAGLPPPRTWRDFVRLPPLTPERLCATPLSEQLDDPRDTLRTATLFLPASVVPAAPTVLDQDDADAAFFACRDAFRLAGVAAGSRVVLLASPARRYLAAEWCDMLGYFGITTHFVIDLHPAELGRALALLEPARVVLLDGGAHSLGPQPHPAGASPPPETRITVRRPDAPGADLYVVPEAGIVAVRPPGARDYLPVRRHILLEAERDGRLLLTAALRYHQPLIRFVLPDRGHIAGGRLVLDEVLP